MAQQIDGFVIPIKKRNVQKYKKLARLACKIWMDHGALQYIEAVGVNLDSYCGVSFTKVYRLKKDETAIFAFIVYASKADQKRVNAKVMTDPRLKINLKDLPFDMKRFSSGFFEVLVKNQK